MPPARRPTPCSSRTPRPRPRRSPGSSPRTSTRARSASSAPPAARSPASSRSRPASGFVTAGGALVIGLCAGGICYSATLLRERLKIDDALDVFAVHGVGGTFGAVATGVFAVAAIGGVSGAIEGNVAQVGTQLVAVVATYAFAGTATFLIVKVVDLVLGIRVPAQSEEVGLDLAVHGEVAYQP